MEIEHHSPSTHRTATATATQTPHPPPPKHLPLLLLNILLLLAGGSAAPLLLRAYFLHGGNRKWFASFLQTAAFPLLLLPLLLLLRRPLPRLSPFLLLSSASLGLLTGLDDLFYSYGISYLPVSTSSLLISTQLGFTAAFAFFIVKQKFTASSVNAVVLLTFAAVVLGVHADGDRPPGESQASYYIGFVMTLVAAVLYGLVLPLVELMYAKSKIRIGYGLVIQIQVVIGLTATVFCAVGMAINKDFQAISRESRLYGLGETNYYLVVIFTAVVSQCFFLGLVGTINYSSALLGGIILAVCVPVTEVLAVFFFHEKFDGEKGVAVALSLWGTFSYFYGEYKASRRGGEAMDSQAKLPVHGAGSSAVSN